MGNTRIQTQIAGAYLIGILMILSFYYIVIEVILFNAEDQFAERRLTQISHSLVAKAESTNTSTPVKIDGLITLYNDFRTLPQWVRAQIGPIWTGLREVDTEFDGREVSLLVLATTSLSGQKMYIVEDLTQSETHSDELSHISSTLLVVGLFVAFLSSYFMLKLATTLSLPLVKLSEQLQRSQPEDLSQIRLSSKTNKEVTILQESINDYRNRLSEALRRERAFTSYASHELRTPLTIIKMATKLLSEVNDPKVVRYCSKLTNASLSMERLINTFLILAREKIDFRQEMIIDHDWISQLVADHQQRIQSGDVILRIDVQNETQVQAPDVLVYVLVGNLLSNACIHAAGGVVCIRTESNRITVSNSAGTDLTHSDKSLGHGIGLVLVKDICKKLNWIFSLTPNDLDGVTATILFNHEEP
ncbi:sensor histidine kinase [Rheinheimera fenheensis]|uniref:sensor histidine kinase n=1 Tax=Rheinheimera fenheensis TaxID=3152295 RepID=UPI00325D23BE